MVKEKTEKQIKFEKQIVKPFEFVLRINTYIICQRYFNIKGYNPDCRESLEIKEMVDDITGVNQSKELGVIPEFFKVGGMDHTMNDNELPYYQQNRTYDKDDIFTFEILRNNVNKLRDKTGDFNLDDLQKQSIIKSMFDGNLFHPNVRYEIDIRSIIPEIIHIIQNGMSLNEYTMFYGPVKLSRFNKLTSEEYSKIYQY